MLAITAFTAFQFILLSSLIVFDKTLHLLWGPAHRPLLSHCHLCCPEIAALCIQNTAACAQQISKCCCRPTAHLTNTDPASVKAADPAALHYHDVPQEQRLPKSYSPAYKPNGKECPEDDVRWDAC